MSLHIRYFSLSFILISIIFLLNSFSLYQIVELLYLFIFIVSFIFDKKFILFLYLFLLPTNFLLVENNTLFGIFGVKVYLSFFALIVSFQIYNSKKYLINLSKKGFNNLLKDKANLFLVFIIFYTVGTLFKDIYTGYNSSYEHLGLSNAFTYSFKLLLLYFPLIYIIKISYLEKYRILFINAFVFGSLILAFTSIFSTQLISLNMIDGLKTDLIQNQISRNSGIFFGGDINSLAGYLVIAIAFFLNFSSSKNFKIFKYACLILIFAVLLSASRSAILGLFLVLFLNFNFKNIVIFFLFISFLIFTNTELILNFIYERFFAMGDEFDKNLDSSRLFIWGVYFNESLNSLSNFLFGVNYKPDIYFSSHNFFITILYRWGIFVLIYFISIYYRLMKNLFFVKNIKIKLFFISIIVPSLFTAFSVSDTGVFVSLIYSLFLFEANTKKYNEKNNILDS